jgi:hypothetical protein
MDILPTRHERQRIFREHVNEKRDLDPCGLGSDKRLMPVSIRSDQSVTFHDHPLIRISGAILPNPFHFAASVAGWDSSHGRLVLQAVRETQYLLLLRRRKAADLIQNGFFQAHAASFLMITETPPEKQTAPTLAGPLVAAAAQPDAASPR